MKTDHDAFVRALLDPAQPVPSGWCAHNHSDPTPRWNVYRNNVVHALLQVLRDTFPALAAEMGAVPFESLAHAYLRFQLPQSPVLTFYGEGLPAFLGAQLAPADRWLCDLARLEWLRIQAFHAADDAWMFDSDQLLELIKQPDLLARAVFELSACVAVVRSTGPVFDAWAGHQSEGMAAQRAWGPQCALVTREGYEVLVIRISEGCTRLIESLKNGLALGKAVDLVAGMDPDFDLVGALALLMKQRCLRQIVVTDGLKQGVFDEYAVDQNRAT
jgi:Putative DNA-binding domain